jgi:hypothetical protein
MGLAGTSTTALYFDNVRVPAANVLGEVGKGHHIAFNVLNIGRLEIGPLALRGAKRVLATCRAYAADRRAFGEPIASFGAIQQMLADAAVRIYAAESATWRVVGLIQDDITTRMARGASRHAAEMQAFEEFAGECSIVKVHASEMLDIVADHGVQIHGGYGYHRDYYVERAYRDARINRIFEGTNEINRILIPGSLLKRLTRRGLSLLEAARATGLPDDSEPAATDEAIVLRARALAVLGTRDTVTTSDGRRRSPWRWPTPSPRRSSWSRAGCAHRPSRRTRTGRPTRARWPPRTCATRFRASHAPSKRQSRPRSTPARPGS